MREELNEKGRLTKGCAALTLVLAGNQPHVAMAAVEGSEDWPGDYPFPELDKFRCPWCGNFEWDEDHQLAAAQEVIGNRLFGDDYYEL